MVKVCVYGPCTKTTKNDPELKFVSFVKPWKDSERAEKWKILCGREDLKITKNTWICSLHFPQNEILDPTRNQNLEPFQAPPNSTRIRLSDKYHQIPRFIPVDHDVLHGTKKYVILLHFFCFWVNSSHSRSIFLTHRLRDFIILKSAKSKQTLV